MLTDACLEQALGALKRASRGGMLVGSQLLAVASTLVGATRLQRSVMAASRAADGTGDYDLFVALTDRIKVKDLTMSTCPTISQSIGSHTVPW